MTNHTANLPVVPPVSAVHPSLRHLLEGRDRVDDQAAGILLPIELPIDSPLRIDLAALRSYPADTSSDEQRSHERYIVHIYDLTTGERLLTNALPATWWDEHLAHVPAVARSTWQRSRPNQWLITDKHLLISGGLWVSRSNSPTGARLYESWTHIVDDENRRVDETQNRWFTRHDTAVAAFHPNWANTVEFYGDDPDAPAEGMIFAADLGPILLRYDIPRHATRFYGAVDGFHPNGNRPFITLTNVREDLTLEHTATLAQTLVDALAAATGQPATITATPA